MISFKQRHFKQDAILMLGRWYVAYALSYRDIEELAAERGLKVDHSTINRWVVLCARSISSPKITPFVAYESFCDRTRRGPSLTISTQDLNNLLRATHNFGS